jgi:hypothetical protein
MVFVLYFLAMVGAVVLFLGLSVTLYVARFVYLSSYGAAARQAPMGWQKIQLLADALVAMMQPVLRIATAMVQMPLGRRQAKPSAPTTKKPASASSLTTVVPCLAEREPQPEPQLEPETSVPTPPRRRVFKRTNK